MFEKLKLKVLEHTGAKSLSSLHIFAIGLISKTLATIVTCTLLLMVADPYIIAKVRQQYRVPESLQLDPKQREKVTYSGSLDVIYKYILLTIESSATAVCAGCIKASSSRY